MHTKNGALSGFMALKDVNHGKKIIPSSGFFKFVDYVKEVSGASSSHVWLEPSTGSSFIFLILLKNSFTHGK